MHLRWQPQTSTGEDRPHAGAWGGCRRATVFRGATGVVERRIVEPSHYSPTIPVSRYSVPPLPLLKAAPIELESRPQLIGETETVNVAFGLGFPAAAPDK